MDSRVVDCLREARARIEKGWCKRYYASNICGDSCNTRSPNAVAWCAIGAIIPYNDIKVKEKAELLLKRFGVSIIFNDLPDTTKEMILKGYDAAIAAAENATVAVA